MHAANLALAIGVIVHIITYLAPSVYIDDQVYTEMTSSAKIALALLPNVALWWGIKILSIEEGRGAGLQWSTLDDRSQPSDSVTMFVVFLMLVADVIIYAAVVWYVDGIRPGKYGVSKKWYFPVQVRTTLFLEQQQPDGFFGPLPLIPRVISLCILKNDPTPKSVTI